MNKNGVFAAIRTAAATHHLLTVGTVLCVAASVGASLLPPLLLARVVDRLPVGSGLTFLAVRGFACAGVTAFFRAGKPARAVRPENDPRPAL